MGGTVTTLVEASIDHPNFAMYTFNSSPGSSVSYVLVRGVGNIPERSR